MASGRWQVAGGQVDEVLSLGRTKLTTFIACRRRFQLRYLRRLPWPAVPFSQQTEAALERGRQFHRLLERHFLGLPVIAEAIGDATARHWWSLFQSSGLQLPNGQRRPELSLTIPIGRHLLTGRFDLLIVGEDNSGAVYAHLFDWKTGQAQSEAALRQDWQTRLYLAMLAEGGEALRENGRSLNPDHLSITYWYVTDPAAPRTIGYSQARHASNWAEIQALVAKIERRLADDDWPLTDAWSHCRRCAYQTYCGRQEAGTAEQGVDDNAEQRDETKLQLEPESP